MNKKTKKVKKNKINKGATIIAIVVIAFTLTLVGLIVVKERTTLLDNIIEVDDFAKEIKLKGYTPGKEVTETIINENGESEVVTRIYFPATEECDNTEPLLLEDDEYRKKSALSSFEDVYNLTKKDKKTTYVVEYRNYKDFLAKNSNSSNPERIRGWYELGFECEWKANKKGEKKSKRCILYINEDLKDQTSY